MSAYKLSEAVEPITVSTKDGAQVIDRTTGELLMSVEGQPKVGDDRNDEALAVAVNELLKFHPINVGFKATMETIAEHSLKAQVARGDIDGFNTDTLRELASSMRYNFMTKCVADSGRQSQHFIKLLAFDIDMGRWDYEQFHLAFVSIPENSITFQLVGRYGVLWLAPESTVTLPNGRVITTTMPYWTTDDGKRLASVGQISPNLFQGFVTGFNYIEEVEDAITTIKANLSVVRRHHANTRGASEAAEAARVNEQLDADNRRLATLKRAPAQF